MRPGAGATPGSAALPAQSARGRQRHLPFVSTEPLEDGGRLATEHRVFRQSHHDSSALALADPVTNPVDEAQEVDAASSCERLGGRHVRCTLQ